MLNLDLNSQCLTPTTSKTNQPITSTTSSAVLKDYRLPKSLKPYYYDLTVKTTFDAQTEPFTYDGDLTIQFSCLQNTNSISIHTNEIDINLSSVVITSASNPGATYTVTSTSYDSDTEIFKMVLSQPLQANQNYTMSMSYLGLSQANNFGFYKSFYLDTNGEKR